MVRGWYFTPTTHVHFASYSFICMHFSKCKGTGWGKEQIMQNITLKIIFFGMSNLGSCPSDAAACLVEGTSHINVGEVAEGLRLESGVLVLKYINGTVCPDQVRKKSTIIRFQCDENRVVSMLQKL